MGTRIISGIIGIAATIVIIMYGGFLFMFCIAALAVLAWLEYVRAFAKIDIKLSLWVGMVCIIGLVLSGAGMSAAFMPLLMLVLTLLLFEMVFCHKDYSAIAACVSFTGVLYIGSGFYYIMQLRLGFPGQILTADGMQTGFLLLWLTLIGTWASDTFAYFTGFFLGRHKLCPSISPKKTIEGFIGGLVGTVVAVTIIGWYISFPLWAMAVLGAFIAVAATLGDLVESIFKRYTGIKDSGNLIPGHGGVLDRFDSLLFTAPLVYYFYIFGHTFLSY